LKHTAFNVLYSGTIMRTWARRAKSFRGDSHEDLKRFLLHDINVWTFYDMDM